MRATKQIKRIDIDRMLETLYERGRYGTTAAIKKYRKNPDEYIRTLVNKECQKMKNGIMRYNGWWYVVLNGERTHETYQFSTGAEQVLHQIIK